MRNLNDYLTEAKSIIEIYSNPSLSEKEHPGNYFFFREHLLGMYLKVRKYTDKELALVKQILRSKVDYSLADTGFKDLINEIVNDITELSGPITKFVQAPIDTTYISDASKFHLAEIWAFDNGFIDEESVWQSKKAYLGAFLNILMDKGVIHKHTLKRPKTEIDKYFTARYGSGLLKTLLRKGSKATAYYHHFDALEDLLDGKV